MAARRTSGRLANKNKNASNSNNVRGAPNEWPLSGRPRSRAGQRNPHPERRAKGGWARELDIN